MVYTLVSAATLGFDLARLPAGRQVADVLLTGLLADAPALGRLARQHRTHCVLDDPELAPRADAGQARRARVLAAGGRSWLAGPPAVPTAPSSSGSPASALLLATLQTSTLGDAESLERLVEGELVEVRDGVDERTAALAREVLADAALASYAADALPAGLRRLLRAGYTTATTTRVARAAQESATTAVLGPNGGDVLAPLAGIASGAPEVRARWIAATDATRDDLGAWARSMHEACWAAHVAGRTRATAVAQLLAVRALDDGGFSAADAAGGVWNAVAGVVQALVLADLLGEGASKDLLAPWRAVQTVVTTAP